MCFSEETIGWWMVYVESITYAKNFSFLGNPPFTRALALVILAPFFIIFCAGGYMLFSDKDGLTIGLFLEELFSFC